MKFGLSLLVAVVLGFGGCSMDGRGLGGRDVTASGGSGGTVAGTGGAGGGLALGGSGGLGSGGSGEGGAGQGGAGGVMADVPGAGGDGGSDPDVMPDSIEPGEDPFALGTECSQAGDCASGHCSDGVCCESACQETCSACLGERTGADDGQCRPITAGSDPDEECAPQPGNSCGRTGGCGGGRACALVAAATVCGEATCVGQTFTPASRCDGLGTCKPGMTAACAADLKCENATACRTSCSSNNHCTAGNYCDPADGHCKAGKALGAACDLAENGGQCASGHCVDGVCCESACGSLCRACAQAKTGVVNGRCAPVKVNSDPDNECKNEDPSSCGLSGTCDGSGACRRYPDGTTCGSTCCARGPGQGGRPCAYQCRNGSCDTGSPQPIQSACGVFTCCCPASSAGGEAACVSPLACPGGCQQ